jgi:phosphatidylglycerophosphatase A
VAEKAERWPVGALRAWIDRPPAASERAAVIFLVTGAYVGYVPIAPGTAGSALGLILARFVLAPIWNRWPAIFLIVFAILFGAGCLLSARAERILGQPDSSTIVLDEVFGMIATMFLNPIGWPWLLAGFVVFRLLDIIKPWPAAQFDSMHGGAGVMLDDLAAGLYANVTLQVLKQIL